MSKERNRKQSTRSAGGTGTDDAAQEPGLQENAEFLDSLARLIDSMPNMHVASDAHELSQIDWVAHAVLRGGERSKEVPDEVRSLLYAAPRAQLVQSYLDVVGAEGQLSQRNGRSAVSREREEIPDGELATVSELARPKIERALVDVRLDEMWNWHKQSMISLAGLKARHAALGTGSRSLSADLGDEGAAAARLLISVMSRNASAISTLEAYRLNWQAAMDAARLSVDLPTRIALEAIGEQLEEDIRPHLQLAYGRFMLEGNTPQLRQELKAFWQHRSHEPGLAYWMSAYCLLAGDYVGAHEAASAAPQQPKIRRTVQPLVVLAPTAGAWENCPANFYTYRHSLIDDEAINTIKETIATTQDWEKVPDPDVQSRIDAAAATAGARAEQAAMSAGGTASATEEENYGEIDVVDKYDRVDASGRRPIQASARTIAIARANRARTAANARAAATAASKAADLAALKQQADVALRALDSLLQWNRANYYLRRGEYQLALNQYRVCQAQILSYFTSRYPGYSIPSTPDGVRNELVRLARTVVKPSTPLWKHFRARGAVLSLEALYNADWVTPKQTPAAYNMYGNGVQFLDALIHKPDKVQEKVDGPLLVIALVHVPLGVAECGRATRQYDVGKFECDQILSFHSKLQVLNPIIEIPFVHILRAQLLAMKADAQYASRAPSPSPKAQPYQGLAAAETCLEIIESLQSQGEYVSRVDGGVADLRNRIDWMLQKRFYPPAQLPGGQGSSSVLSPSERRQFEALGKMPPIQTLVASSGGLPDVDRTTAPLEALLAFRPPDGQPTLRENNPVIYALIAGARARLAQMQAGLNYLGYTEDYVPPFRFEYLLDRARYFAEHAKDTERDYLNFLSKAEDEEFREDGAAQAVSLGKSNIRVETARVGQATQEVGAAKAASELATLAGANAKTRIDNFRTFDDHANHLADEMTDGATLRIVSATAGGAAGGASTGSGLVTTGGAIAAGAVIGTVVPGLGTAIGAGVGAIVGGLSAWLSSSSQETDKANQLAIAAAQRQDELENLRLASKEAEQSAAVAAKQLEVAKAGLVVTALQRAMALLQHDFAVQNLTFLKDRKLNAEQWYRLARLIEGISETYLRYAIEIGYLTEQAYELKADKQVNVIRFDYDQSATAGMLAGDFLVADLGRLEADQLTTERQRQQPVRYVVSLARDFPGALQQLRETGQTLFSTSLKQLEQRFPGLYNVRIGAIDVLPVALMDPTRFNLQLTHSGTSLIRRKGRAVGPDALAASRATDVDSWIPAIDPQWPVSMRLSNPETSVFSGLTRTDQDASFPFTATHQRNAFEDLGAAASWHLDMSLRENGVFPGALADVLLTMTLNGFHDQELRSAIESTPPTSAVLTQYLSAARAFPDSFYEFQQTGKVEYGVTSDILSLDASTSRLRNLGIILVPNGEQPQFNALLSTYVVKFRIAAESLEVLSEIPQLTFRSNGLVLEAQAVVSADALLSWQFGDGSEWTDWILEGSQRHTYVRPGRYQIDLRVAKDEVLSEYRAEVQVAQDEILQPVTAYPSLSTGSGAPDGHTRVITEVQNPDVHGVTGSWRMLGWPDRFVGASASYDLPPGTYQLHFVASRDLSARLYCRRRHTPDEHIRIEQLRISSNRDFDDFGNEQNEKDRNPLAQHLFAKGPLSPADRWTFQLKAEDNPFLQDVTTAEDGRIHLAGLEDAVLVLEYETNPASATGLKGEYFDGIDLMNLKLVRVDPVVDFDWGEGSPGGPIGKDRFSVRWTGYAQPGHSETYTFFTVTDDGVRLWVNEQLLIDDWNDHEPVENSGTIELVAGQEYAIRLEFYESTGGAMVQLLWSSPSQPKEVIPQRRLLVSSRAWPSI
jgi:hypothetical protein